MEANNVPAVNGEDIVQVVEPGAITPEMSYDQRLFHHSHVDGLSEPCFPIFRGLQRLNIICLQNKLAESEGVVWKNMSASDKEMVELERTLAQYSTYSQPAMLS